MREGIADPRAVVRSAACIGLALVGVGLVTATPAAARGHLAATFHLKGSHGYAIRVAAYRAALPLDMTKADHRVGKLTVVARKTSESASSAEGGSASYTVPARFNKHRIRANLGPFGHVRLRFHKRPRFTLPPARAAAQKRRIGVCGQFGFYVPGEFRGILRFRGEGGYTGAHAHRIHGELHRDGPVECAGHDRGTELKARSGPTRFLAFQDDDFGATVLVASTRDRSGRVDIARDAHRIVSVDADEFTFDSALTSAHVAPGGELFTGSADYASPGSWAGSLAASFPGGEDVSLAGPDFGVTLRSTESSAAARFAR
jgi:hypothetical protein